MLELSLVCPHGTTPARIQLPESSRAVTDLVRWFEDKHSGRWGCDCAALGQMRLEGQIEATEESKPNPIYHERQDALGIRHWEPEGSDALFLPKCACGRVADMPGGETCFHCSPAGQAPRPFERARKPRELLNPDPSCTCGTFPGPAYDDCPVHGVLEPAPPESQMPRAAPEQPVEAPEPPQQQWWWEKETPTGIVVEPRIVRRAPLFDVGGE